MNPHLKAFYQEDASNRWLNRHDKKKVFSAWADSRGEQLHLEYRISKPHLILRIGSLAIIVAYPYLKDYGWDYLPAPTLPILYGITFGWPIEFARVEHRPEKEEST